MLNVEDSLSDAVEQTLLIPLWCCATPCRANPEASYDPLAVRVIQTLDFDFSNIKKSFKEYGQVCCLAREMYIDRCVSTFLAHNPEGTIVNLGCGFSTAAFRSKRTQALWYDIDQAPVIEARRKILPEDNGEILLAYDMYDPAWMTALDYSQEKGILFLAAGVFHYQDPKLLLAFLSLLAGKYPGGTLVFDAVSRLGLRISNAYVKRSGNTEATMRFSVRSPMSLKEASPHFASVSTEPYFAHFPKSDLTLASRINIALVKLFSMLFFVTIAFSPNNEA